MLQTEKEEHYTVYDHNNGQFFDFDDLDEMFGTMGHYCWSKYGGNFGSMAVPSFDFQIVQTRPDNYCWDLTAPTKAKSLYVVDSDGHFVDIKKIPPRYYFKTYDDPHRKFIYARNELIESNLVIKRDNVHKVKKTHARKLKFRGWIQEFDYSRVVRGHYRHIHTVANRRKIEGVIKDEGEPVFRGKQRNLPTYWDEISLSVHKSFKSWKHNSKRRKQWKIKG